MFGEHEATGSNPVTETSLGILTANYPNDRLLVRLRYLASCQISSLVEHSSRIVSRFICPVSSAVERFVDIEEVSGSTPLSDTKL
jgi:hypothetical protein